MPEDFGFPSREDLWLPLAPGASVSQDRDDRSLAVLARLRGDASRDAVEAAWHATAARLAAVYPATNTGIDVNIERFGSHQVGELWNSPALMLPVTAALVLLIACTNVANLLLARATLRTRELALRASVGASRWRLVRQMLVESLLLAALGGLTGFGLATLGVKAMAASFFEGNVPYWMTFTTNARSLVAVGTFCLLSTVAFGLAPALRASRRGTTAATQAGVRSRLSARTDPWRARLTAVQFALAVILLGGAGLLVSSYRALLHVDGLVDASQFTTLRLILSEGDQTIDDNRRADLYRQLEEGLAALPGVEAVALANVVPFLGAPRHAVSISGREDAQPLNVPVVMASSRYFDTLGLAMRGGRSFQPTDNLPEPQVAIVNDLFVDRYFTNRDAIGARIHLASEPDAPLDLNNASWLTIVGIAPTIRQQAPGGPRPLVYVPLSHGARTSLEVILRTPVLSSGTTAGIRTRLSQIDHDLVIANLRPLTVSLRNSRLQPQLIATVLGSLGTVALFLAAVGLYAITAHGVGQRRPEIGVRLALGGRPGQIVTLLMRQSMTPIAVGLVVGLTGAFVVGQLLRGLLIGTSPTDPATFTALALLLVAVTTLACYLPARRSTRVDPAAILRED